MLSCRGIDISQDVEFRDFLQIRRNWVELCRKWRFCWNPWKVTNLPNSCFRCFQKNAPFFAAVFLEASLGPPFGNRKKTRKNHISQIARNVPRIRHLLERPRRTFTTHEGHQNDPFWSFSTDFVKHAKSPENWIPILPFLSKKKGIRFFHRRNLQNIPMFCPCD